MEAQVGSSTVLTLELDAASHEYFERLRQQHYPAELNRIGAHVTLFHTLPPAEEIRGELQQAAAAHEPFSLRVTGLRSLGRGVAFTMQSAAAQAVHGDLAAIFAEVLSRQDAQKFSPHVVVQNKSTPEKARLLKADLERSFKPFEVQATGLRLWHYLGGPWKDAGLFPFQSNA